MTLAASPYQYFYDSDTGDALSNGTVTYWENNSQTTKATAYQDPELSTAHDDDISLDSDGKMIAYLPDGLYGVELKDADGVQKWRIDDYKIQTGTIARTSGEISAGITPSNLLYDPGVNLRYGTDAQGVLDAFNSGAGCVRILKGTYAMDNSSEITINESNICIECDPDAELTMNTNGVGIVLTGTNVTWRGGRIRGTGAVDTGGGTRQVAVLLVDGATHTSRADVFISRVDILDPNSAAIGVHQAVGVHIDQCTAVDSTGSTSTARIGMYANECAHVTWSRNYVNGFGTCIGGGGENTGTPYDSYDGDSDNNARGYLVEGNTVVKYADHGVYFSDYMGESRVIGNYAFSAEATAVNSYKIQGDDLTLANNNGTSPNGVSLRNARRAVVTGNRIEVTGTGTTIYAMEASGSTVFEYDWDEVTVTDNIFRSTNATGAWMGIRIRGEMIDTNTQRLLRNVNVSRNTIQGYFGKLGSNPAGISIRQDRDTADVHGERVIVKDNIIDLTADGHTNSNYGIRLRTGLDDCIVADNIVNNVITAGLDFADVEGCKVTGNRLTASADATGDTGILVDSASAGFTFAHNVITNFTTESVIQPADTGYLYPYRELTGTDTYDIGGAPGILAGATESTTVAVTGAIVSDIDVVAGHTSSLGGLMMTASITSADTATVVFYNPTGGTINPASGTLTVRVRRTEP